MLVSVGLCQRRVAREVDHGEGSVGHVRLGRVAPTLFGGAGQCGRAVGSTSQPPPSSIAGGPHLGRLWWQRRLNVQNARDGLLTMMIEHHQGAIEMAKTEQKDGMYADAVALTKQIQTA